MTQRFATNSWQAREALARREPYNTHGAMRAIEGATGGYANTGRLPEPYDTEYREAAVAGRITYTVLSYWTPIAWVLDDGEVIIPPVKYSVTTSGHQGLLYALESDHRQRIDLADAAFNERQTARQRRTERFAERTGLAPVIPMPTQPRDTGGVLDRIRDALAEAERSVPEPSGADMAGGSLNLAYSDRRAVTRKTR